MSLRAIDIECRKITTHKCTVQLGGNKSKGSVSCIDTRQQELVFADLHLPAGGYLGAVDLTSKPETSSPEACSDLLVGLVRLRLYPVERPGQERSEWNRTPCHHTGSASVALISSMISSTRRSFAMMASTISAGERWSSASSECGFFRSTLHAVTRPASSRRTNSPASTCHARSFVSRSFHHARQGANSSKVSGTVLEYFLRPSGRGCS